MTSPDSPAVDVVSMPSAAGAPTGCPWRRPAEETPDLYPGLTVDDGRVTGSITVGRTRLPVWAFLPAAVGAGWDEAEAGWEPSRYGWTDEQGVAFVHDLLDLRGDFARLLLVLANAERCDRYSTSKWPWWARKGQRSKVRRALEDCLSALDREAL